MIEYNKNYRKTLGSLWNYYRDEPNSGSDDVGNNRINYFIKDSKDYKAVITGKLEGNNKDKKEVEIVAALKYLSNFWRTLDMPLNNCEVSLTFTWSKNCVLTSKAYRRRVANPRVPPKRGKSRLDGINIPTGAIFEIKDAK